MVTGPHRNDPAASPLHVLPLFSASHSWIPRSCSFLHDRVKDNWTNSLFCLMCRWKHLLRTYSNQRYESHARLWHQHDCVVWRAERVTVCSSRMSRDWERRWDHYAQLRILWRSTAYVDAWRSLSSGKLVVLGSERTSDNNVRALIEPNPLFCCALIFAVALFARAR